MPSNRTLRRAAAALAAAALLLSPSAAHAAHHRHYTGAGQYDHSWGQPVAPQDAHAAPDFRRWLKPHEWYTTPLSACGNTGTYTDGQMYPSAHGRSRQRFNDSGDRMRFYAYPSNRLLGSWDGVQWHAGRHRVLVEAWC
jgi:hypothetical protein